MTDVGLSLDLPTRGTRRARWGMLATVFVMAVALVMTGVMTWIDHRDASEAVAVTRAQDLFRAVRRNLRDASEPRAEVDALVTDFAEAGLRYVALVSRRGEVVASAGTPRGTMEHDEAEVPIGREPKLTRVTDRIRLDAPVGPGRGGYGRPPPRLVIEVEPVLADDLMQRARTQLIVSASAATLLLVIGLLFWRSSVRRDQVEALLARNRRLAALGEMSAVLGHELRNPLASLKGHAQLVVERIEPAARARKSAERVVLEAERLETLTTQVLDFARTGAIHRVPEPPADVLRRAAEIVGSPRIQLDVAEAPSVFSFDGTRMQQVLVNLLRNAIEAPPRELGRDDAAPSDQAIGTTIDARCGLRDGRLTFVVRDRGAGFPPDALEHVFEPFRTHRIQGTGLGLAIARRIVEAHGGTIIAANAPESSGGGAIVTVELPAPGGA